MVEARRRPHPEDTHPDESDRVVRALRVYVNESELFLEATSREAEMHRTDLSGLAVIMDRTKDGETTTPGQLSTALHLSAPATSAMLERLERLGHVGRSAHPNDRRSVVVTITDRAMEVGQRMFGGLGAHFAPVFVGRSEEELDLIAGFLEEVSAATRAARDEIGPPPPH